MHSIHLHPSICIQKIEVPDPVVVILDNDEDIERELESIWNNPVIHDDETFEVFDADGLVDMDMAYADLRKRPY